MNLVPIDWETVSGGGHQLAPLQHVPHLTDAWLCSMLGAWKRTIIYRCSTIHQRAWQCAWGALTRRTSAMQVLQIVTNIGYNEHSSNDSC